MVELAGLAPEVVHELPGRVRLRLPALRHDPALAERLQAAALASPGIDRVRLNTAAGSLVLEGRPAALHAAIHGDLLRRAQAIHEVLPAPLAASPSNGPSRAQVALAVAGFVLSQTSGAPLLVATACATLSLLPYLRSSVGELRRERRLGVRHLELAALAALLLTRDLRGLAATAVLDVVARNIRERTARRTRGLVARFRPPATVSVEVQSGGEARTVAADQLRVGDLIALTAGATIPVDGVVAAGEGWVVQQALTGERRPLARAEGDPVLAGTRLVGGWLHVRAQAVGAATRAARIYRALDQAPVHDSRAADHAAQFADRLAAPVLALAGLTAASTRSLSRTAAVLNVDVSTGLDVSAPTAILTTMAHAAHLGVLFKSGRAVEQLAQVSAVVFDKTGTLTLGAPVVAHVVSLDERFAERELLTAAASAELNLRHRLARAIVRRARQQRLTLATPARQERSPVGGVCALVDGRAVRVGTARYLEQAGLPLDREHPTAKHLLGEGQALSYVAIDDVVVGVIGYHDPVRGEAATLVRWLRHRGVPELHLVTGDEHASAEAVARAVGIRHVHARLLADDKAAVVRELQGRGRCVAFVGDDLDDRLAMRLADVAIALRQGAPGTRDAAEVELLHSNLLGIRRAVELARGGRGLIRQNLVLAGAPSLLGLGLAATGALGPVGVRVLGDVGTLLAATNSLRPLFQTAPRRPGEYALGHPRHLEALP